MRVPDWAREYFERGYAQRWGLPAPSENVRREAAGIWNLLQLSTNSRVIDIGCGHGRHALALAERGCAVTGIDFSASLLSRARQLVEASHARVDWVLGDMRRLPFGGQCADAVLIMDAFGFFETEDDDEAAVGEARRILRNGGLLLMKVVNGVPIVAAFRHTAHEQHDGSEVSIANTLTLDPPRMTQRLRIRGSRGEGDYERRQRLYRVEELQAMLERAGFSVAAVFSNADGVAFAAAESSTIWIAARR